MDELQLSETEQRYFSDLFVCCDYENTGKVSHNKAFELFRSGNVSTEILNQIADLCNHKGSSSFNRKQFYSFLKLIAAHQAAIPLRGDILTSMVDLPLPRFTWPSSERTDLIELNDAKTASYSTDSDANQRNGSPEASSTASDSPTPTNSVQERSWAVSGNWQGLVCEEQRQLLGTEEESSDRHSSEEDTDVATEVWTITTEQKEYYANQFKQLQPDLNGLLAGHVARKFFEKSMLPVSELRKIWQLSDVTKDGLLSLQEFNTAMHLVVLRRNHINLPFVLPPQLMPEQPDRPQSPQNVEPSDSNHSPSHLSSSKDASSKEWTKFVDSPTSSISSPGPKPVNFDFQKASVEKDPKILHPVPLRLTPDIPQSDDNQDDQKKTLEDIRPIQRPQPKKIGLPGRGAIPPPPQQIPNADEGPVSLPAPKKDKPPPPPPRPFRSHGRSSSLDLNRLGKNGFLGAPPTVPPRISPNISSSPIIKKLINQRSEGSGEESTTIFADFDQFDDVGAAPTSSRSTGEKYENVSEGIFPGDVYEAERKKLFAQFTTTTATVQQVQQSDQVDAVVDCGAPRKHGAFEVYRKPVARHHNNNNNNNNNNKGSPLPVEEAAKMELFKKLKEQNTVLLRLCQELSQELADVREERTTLRLRLEQQQLQQQSAG